LAAATSPPLLAGGKRDSPRDSLCWVDRSCGGLVARRKASPASSKPRLPTASERTAAPATSPAICAANSTDAPALIAADAEAEAACEGVPPVATTTAAAAFPARELLDLGVIPPSRAAQEAALPASKAASTLTPQGEEGGGGGSLDLPPKGWLSGGCVPIPSPLIEEGEGSGDVRGLLSMSMLSPPVAPVALVASPISVGMALVASISLSFPRI